MNPGPKRRTGGSGVGPAAPGNTRQDRWYGQLRTQVLLNFPSVALSSTGVWQRDWLLRIGGSSPSSCAWFPGKGHSGSGFSECCNSLRGGGPCSWEGAGWGFGASYRVRNILLTLSCLGRTEGWSCMDQHQSRHPLGPFPHPFWIPGGGVFSGR